MTRASSSALLSDQVNAIPGVFSGRHLQLFTTGGEWMVSGEPLTPSSIQLNRQTRIGSSAARMIPPVDVDGSTSIFAARSGRAIHRFAYTDVQQAYQSNDLGLVAAHLIRSPTSMAYDQSQRLLHVVMEDGGLARTHAVPRRAGDGLDTAETAGAFTQVAELDGRVYVTVLRAGTVRLERFEPGFGLDAALDGSSMSRGIAGPALPIWKARPWASSPMARRARRPMWCWAPSPSIHRPPPRRSAAALRA